LNVAEPLARRDYGKAAFEVVGPILLVGWSEVGPALLREIHTASTSARGTSELRAVESDSWERAAVRVSSVLRLKFVG
jgi:hypothetical protein